MEDHEVVNGDSNKDNEDEEEDEDEKSWEKTEDNEGAAESALEKDQFKPSNYLEKGPPSTGRRSKARYEY